MSTAESSGTYIDSTTELQQLVIEALRPGEGVFFNTDVFDDGTILVKISIAGQHEKASRLIHGINNFLRTLHHIVDDLFQIACLPNCWIV